MEITSSRLHSNDPEKFFFVFIYSLLFYDGISCQAYEIIVIFFPPFIKKSKYLFYCPAIALKCSIRVFFFFRRRYHVNSLWTFCVHKNSIWNWCRTINLKFTYLSIYHKIKPFQTYSSFRRPSLGAQNVCNSKRTPIVWTLAGFILRCSYRK